MRILFALRENDNSKNDIVDVILNEYQRIYKKIISYKRVFYYNAILNEIKASADNRYDMIIIGEDLEKSMSDSYEAEDEYLYKLLDEITDEACKEDGTAIPVMLISSDRRNEKDPIVSKLFVLGIYNILIGKERTIQNVCSLIERPRGKKQAKIIYGLDPEKLYYTNSIGTTNKIISEKELINIQKFFSIYKGKIDKCVRGFSKIAKEYNESQLQYIIENLPLDVRIVLEENSSEYMAVAKEKVADMNKHEDTYITRDIGPKQKGNQNVIIPD